LVLAMESRALAGSDRLTGLVVRVDAGKGTLLVLENGHHAEVMVGKDCLFLDDQGDPLEGLTAVQVGDHVRHELILQHEKASVGQVITILRPAWRMLESPE